MKKYDLQLFAGGDSTATPVQGKRIVYLFRLLKNAATNVATAMAFTTENEKSVSNDADTTATKDGAVNTPGTPEIEISATALLAKGNNMAEEFEDACLDNELVEVWEANLDEPAEEGQNKFKGRYYQANLTEFTLTSSAEEHAEYECTFKVNGKGAKGDITVTEAQQEVANYVFKDTQAAGA